MRKRRLERTEILEKEEEALNGVTQNSFIPFSGPFPIAGHRPSGNMVKLEFQWKGRP